MSTPELTGRQRRYLRRQAHSLRPVVHVGKNGLTDEVVASIDDALEVHELIKVKFVDFKDSKSKADLSREMASRSGSHVAGRVGHVTILYRENEDPDLRRVQLPD